MAYAKYSKLPTEEEDNASVKLDFSSAFTFEERGIRKDNYKSVFTYGIKDELQPSPIERRKLESERGSSSRFTWLLVYFGYLILYVMAFPLLVWFSLKRVKDGERMVVFRLGHLQKPKGPGLALVLPFLDTYQKKDVRLRAFSVPPKQIITGDKAIIEVGAEIYFQIVDVEKSVTNVQDLDRSTRVLVQTALCNLLSQRALAAIVSERRALAEVLMNKSNGTCSAWGVEITRTELSEIKVLSQPLPQQTPTVMMPPGLFDAFLGGGGAAGAGGGHAGSSSSSGVPAMFAQLATSLTSGQGQNQTEAIAQALQAMVVPHLTDNSDGTPNSDNITSENDDNAGSQPPHFPATTTASLPPAKTPEYPVDPAHILTLIREALCEQVVAKVQETYQFDITSGAGQGSYYLNLRDGAGCLLEGPDPSGSPSATLTMTLSDLQAMLHGELQPYQAYMCGRLRVAGDTSAALKLDALGTRIKELQEGGSSLH